MKIKSSFKDFYDNAGGFDKDDSLLYFRKTIKEETAQNFPGFCGDMGRLGNYYDAYSFYALRAVWVGLNKKLYPCVRHRSETSNEKIHCYTIEQLDKVIEAHLAPKNFSLYMGRKSDKYDRKLSHVPNRPRLVEFFQTEFEADLFQKYPIFVAYPSSTGTAVWPHDPLSLIYYNANLKEVQFFRRLEAHIVWQEVSMYIGALANPEPPIPKLDDKTMAQIKGFDKYSFRKDKSK